MNVQAILALACMPLQLDVDMQGVHVLCLQTTMWGVSGARRFLCIYR